MGTRRVRHPCRPFASCLRRNEPNYNSCRTVPFPSAGCSEWSSANYSPFASEKDCLARSANFNELIQRNSKPVAVRQGKQRNQPPLHKDSTPSPWFVHHIFECGFGFRDDTFDYVAKIVLSNYSVRSSSWHTPSTANKYSYG